MDEIPTGISPREAELLRHLPEYHPNVIEIGSLFGYSTIQLATNAEQVVSIDPHEDYPEPGAPSTWKPFLNNVTKYAPDTIFPIKEYFENVEIPDADMAFIDLDGKFMTTYRCIFELLHVPLILVHDYGRQSCPGVAQAIHHFNYEIKVVDTTAILYYDS